MEKINLTPEIIRELLKDTLANHRDPNEALKDASTTSLQTVYEGIRDSIGTPGFEEDQAQRSQVAAIENIFKTRDVNFDPIKWS